MAIIAIITEKSEVVFRFPYVANDTKILPLGNRRLLTDDINSGRECAPFDTIL